MTATATKPEFAMKKTSLWSNDTGRVVFMWNGNSEASDVTLVWYPPGGSTSCSFLIEFRFDGTLAPSLNEIILDRDVFLTTGRTTARAIWDRLLACKWTIQESWNFK